MNNLSNESMKELTNGSSPAKSRRSKLTQDDTRVKRAELVTFGQPMRDKYRSSGQQREMVATPSSVSSRQPVGKK